MYKCMCLHNCYTHCMPVCTLLASACPTWVDVYVHMYVEVSVLCKAQVSVQTCACVLWRPPGAYTVHVSHLSVTDELVVYCLESEVQFRNSDLVVLVAVHVVVDPPVVGELLLVYNAVLG